MMKKLRSRSEEMHGLHGDLVAEILIRLDAKTLFNCRQVCKTWNQIISDPIFTACRLRNSNLVFVDSWAKNNEALETVYTVSICDHNVGMEEGDFIPISMNLLGLDTKTAFTEFSFSSTSCDLLCYTRRSVGHRRNLRKRVFLYNPRTGKVHKLPACPGFRFVASYGYVAATREYMVVAHTGTAEASGLAKFCFTDTTSGISWKKIDMGYFPQGIGAEILIHNCVYCIASDSKILKLDLDKNTYAMIKGPREFCVKEIDTVNVRLIDFEGSLCLVDLYFLEESKKLIVWEYSAGCWKKKYDVEHDFQAHITDIHPKSSKEGDLILQGVGVGVRNGDLVYLMFNPETKRVKQITVPYFGGTIKDLQLPNLKMKMQQKYTKIVSFL